MHKKGQTFLTPVAQHESKISSVRRWDQAFRVYATFYCGANPSRAREVWQYVDVIHTAAASYAWDNVYNYDVTFRHLMEFNPNRSWAVTYNHMWNLSLRDPVAKNGFSFSRGSYSGGNNYSSNSGKTSNMGGANTGKKAKKRVTYCWNWNKGVQCKYAPKCKFIERCSYCDANMHGIHACPKLDAKSCQEHLAKLGGKSQLPVSGDSN